MVGWMTVVGENENSESKKFKIEVSKKSNDVRES